MTNIQEIARQAALAKAREIIGEDSIDEPEVRMVADAVAVAMLREMLGTYQDQLRDSPTTTLSALLAAFAPAPVAPPDCPMCHGRKLVRSSHVGMSMSSPAHDWEACPACAAPVTPEPPRQETVSTDGEKLAIAIQRVLARGDDERLGAFRDELVAATNAYECRTYERRREDWQCPTCTGWNNPGDTTCQWSCGHFLDRSSLMTSPPAQEPETPEMCACGIPLADHEVRHYMVGGEQAESYVCPTPDAPSPSDVEQARNAHFDAMYSYARAYSTQGFHDAYVRVENTADALITAVRQEQAACVLQLEAELEVANGEVVAVETRLKEQAAEIERLKERVAWFEQSGGVAVHTKVHELMMQITRLTDELAEARDEIVRAADMALADGNTHYATKMAETFKEPA